MAASALEIETRRVLARLRDFLQTRDRAVVLALLLSVVPLPPSNAIALVLSVVNLILIGSGRLPRSDLGLVLAAMALSVGSGCFFFYVFGDMIRLLLQNLVHLFHWLSALGVELHHLLDAPAGSSSSVGAAGYRQI